MDFTTFCFHESLTEGLESMGFKAPTPIQAETIPLIQSAHDLIACAQTGTGKTAAYLLPLMDSICKSPDRPAISALILAPTRELAIQIDQQVEGLAYFAGLSSIAIYGGGDGIGYEQQRRALRDGVDIVIATPGRLIAHLSSGIVQFGQVRTLVLDEADRMLDMGFKDDINRIVRELPGSRQTVMFSATMPPKIRSFAKTLLNEPKQVNIAISQPAEKIRQIKYRTFDGQKIPLLKQLLSTGEYQRIIVFSSTKDKVKEAYKELKKLGLDIRPFHSDLTQDEREKLLLQFRNRQLSVLIGTDVLSRGIDVDGIDLVVNFDVPPDPEDYIHRIGRTARAERTGTAITFVNNRDFGRFTSIEKLMGFAVTQENLPEGLGEAPGPVSERDSRGGGRDGRSGSDRKSSGHHGSRNADRSKKNRNGSRPEARPKASAEKPEVNTENQNSYKEEATNGLVSAKNKRRNNRKRNKKKQIDKAEVVVPQANTA